MSVLLELHAQWKQARANIDKDDDFYLSRTFGPKLDLTFTAPPPAVEKCPDCGGSGVKPMESVPRHPTLRSIVMVVSRVRGVPVRNIHSERRTNNVAHARQEVAWLAYELTPYSFPQIGAYMRRDHTTMLHGCRAVKKRMEDEAYAAVLNQMRDELLGGV